MSRLSLQLQDAPGSKKAMRLLFGARSAIRRQAASMGVRNLPARAHREKLERFIGGSRQSSAGFGSLAQKAWPTSLPP